MGSDYLGNVGLLPVGGSWRERFNSQLTSVHPSGGKRRVARVLVRNVALSNGITAVARLAANTLGVSVTLRCQWSGRLLFGRLLAGEWLIGMSDKEIWDMASAFFKRPPSNGSTKDGGGDPVDPKFEKAYPTLWQYLSAKVWPDGEVRKRSSLVVFAEDSMLKGCLSDRDTDSSLWAASGTFTGLLEALEGRLTEDIPEWRAKPKKK